MQSWLLNEDCHDQYSVIYDGGEHTAIMLNTGQEPTVIEERAVGLLFVASVKQHYLFFAVHVAYI